MIPNKKKITKEFCQGNVKLQFFPKTVEEAFFIRSQFVKMGFETYGTIPLEEHTALGMYFLNKTIVGGKTDYSDALLCDSGQFETPYLSDRDFMMEQFNRLAARLDAIEARGVQSAAEIAAIREELRPQTLDKPSLGNPKPAAGG